MGLSALSPTLLGDAAVETQRHSLSNIPTLVANPESTDVSFRSDLDVGITVSTEVPIQSGTRAEASFRKTEAQLLAGKQRLVFDESGRWGVVRLFPQHSVLPQLILDLVVCQSDGRELLIEASLTAVNGDVLLNQIYFDRSGMDGFEGTVPIPHADRALDLEGPFADLFHRIHTDAARVVFESARSKTYLGTISFLRYAQQLAPTAFSGYLNSRDGEWILLREPSEKDPMYARIAKLRDYELLFVDTIDEQLGATLRDIDVAYTLWLTASKEQLDWLERRRARGLQVESFTDDSAFARHQAVYAAYRSLKIHEQELFELVLDLESESRSTALKVEDTVVKLEGTLEQQYREWRETLLKIIQLENTF